MVLLNGNANRPREILGDEGHGIDVMRRRNLPVPPAFCIATDVGVRYLAGPAVHAALDAGHTDVVWATPLIVMLTALRLEMRTSPCPN